MPIVHATLLSGSVAARHVPCSRVDSLVDGGDSALVRSFVPAGFVDDVAPCLQAEKRLITDGADVTETRPG